MSISLPLLTFIQPPMLTEEQIYLEEWTNSSRLLFYSVISIAFFTLPILIFIFCWIRCKTIKNPHYLPYLSAISGGNIVLLGSLAGGVITENTDLIYDLLPGYLICKSVAFLVNTSSCFIHWSWVAMYAERFCCIFYPLRFRSHNSCRTCAILLLILLTSMCIQLWTPIFITGRRLDSQMDNMYCGEDPRHNQVIEVLEVFATFFLPLTLTIFADISVLTWKSTWGSSIHLLSQDHIRSGKNTGGLGSRKHSHMKIVSSDSLRNSHKRRSNAIRRCLISATITLFLNLPNYSLQIDALVYILYLIQFPITSINIYLLTRKSGRKESADTAGKMNFMSSTDPIMVRHGRRSTRKKRNSLLG
ncbi:hypothetical protein B9Z55_022082 [Caenorhabditis nigoni]|uniref:G-protein coupled receptors family 1 profile domain-containing protein n=1 Tax=Caenorhabditis nigoni TaxID=1611254 RepID=A0A2G5TUP7_9PELO|nr:hypothetical protein B9Z55_022082 [Caenorhabditis nigoni]